MKRPVLAFVILSFPVLALAWDGPKIDTSKYMVKPLDYRPVALSRPIAEAVMEGFNTGQTIGQAMRAGRERDKKRTQQRVNSAVPLCNKLRAAILAGEAFALEACLGVLLE